MDKWGTKWLFKGSFRGLIILTNANDNNNQKSLGEFYPTTRSSCYDNNMLCTTIYFTEDYCSATIEWRCGEGNYEIIAMSEPSPCEYQLIGEVNCKNFSCIGLLIPKLEWISDLIILNIKF